MPRTRPPYPPEFRRQMVELVRAGRTPEELSQEFEPTAWYNPHRRHSALGQKPPLNYEKEHASAA